MAAPSALRFGAYAAWQFLYCFSTEALIAQFVYRYATLCCGRRMGALAYAALLVVPALASVPPVVFFAWGAPQNEAAVRFAEAALLTNRGNAAAAAVANESQQQSQRQQQQQWPLMERKWWHRLIIHAFFKVVG